MVNGRNVRANVSMRPDTGAPFEPIRRTVGRGHPEACNVGRLKRLYRAERKCGRRRYGRRCPEL
jgi:hypothetical protein